MNTHSLGRHIPLSAIYPSNTNPRKRFNEADLQELAESIKQHGVMQPILVRPTNVEAVRAGTADYAIYEIVAGERRYRASKLAGEETIPAIERELNDLETLQLQIIENLQRQDLHPLEEAQGFKALLDNKDAKSWNADELAAKIGKSRSYIYGALKLNELCVYAQDMFLDGKFGRETALLIARIPGEKLQTQATKEIVKGNGQDTFSYRAAKYYVHERYTLSLETAPFDTHTNDLLPEAGSCFSCPKRSGNYPELFSDIESADVCTDPDCFGKKKALHVQALIAKAPKALTGDEALKIMPYGVNSYMQDSNYAKPSSYATSHGKRWEELLGDDLPEPILLVDDKNNTTQVYETSALEQKLEEKIASGELSLESQTSEEKTAYEIEREELTKKQAEETQRRLHIFNRVAPNIAQQHLTIVLRMAIDELSRETSTDFEPVLNLYDFEGTEEEFFTNFQQSKQDIASLTKMLALLLIAPSVEVSGWQWKSESDNEKDKDYQLLLTFIGNIGLDVSQFLTAELPLPPPIAALQSECSAEVEPCLAQIEEVVAMVEQKNLPKKLQEIKDKELAKRARRAQRQEQKESAKADV